MRFHIITPPGTAAPRPTRLPPPTRGPRTVRGSGFGRETAADEKCEGSTVMRWTPALGPVRLGESRRRRETPREGYRLGAGGGTLFSYASCGRTAMTRRRKFLLASL